MIVEGDTPHAAVRRSAVLFHERGGGGQFVVEVSLVGSGRRGVGRGLLIGSVEFGELHAELARHQREHDNHDEERNDKGEDRAVQEVFDVAESAAADVRVHDIVNAHVAQVEDGAREEDGHEPDDREDEEGGLCGRVAVGAERELNGDEAENGHSAQVVDGARAEEHVEKDPERAQVLVEYPLVYFY